LHIARVSSSSCLCFPFHHHHPKDPIESLLWCRLKGEAGIGGWSGSCGQPATNKSSGCTRIFIHRSVRARRRPFSSPLSRPNPVTNPHQHNPTPTTTIIQRGCSLPASS
jgi:hypothetical protein